MKKLSKFAIGIIRLKFTLFVLFTLILNFNAQSSNPPINSTKTNGSQITNHRFRVLQKSNTPIPNSQKKVSADGRSTALPLADTTKIKESLLWRIGKNDESSNEFATNYGASMIDSLIIPTNWDTRQNWRDIPKGLKLSDNGTLIISYYLDKIPKYGTKLRFRVLNANRVIPQLAVYSNEIFCGLIQIAGLEGSDVDLKYKETYQLYIPKEFLNTGKNQLRLSLDRGLFANESGDRFHRFSWDYLAFEALNYPATEPIHGRYIHLGNDFRARDQYINARTCNLLSKWSGVAFSGNWMRVGITIEEKGLTKCRTAYLQTLKDLNFRSMPIVFTTQFINNKTGSGTVSSAVKSDFIEYLKNYGDLIDAIEISNEPGLFNTSQSGNLAMTQLAVDLKPEYAPHLRIVAPGWAYWPSNGTPDGWARNPEMRKSIELLSDYTNGHSYTTSGTQGIGGTLAETLLTYNDHTGDAFPKEMVMSETGGNDNATDNDAYGTTQFRHAAVFDREMRGNIGYVDHIMYHGDHYPVIFSMFDYPGGVDNINPIDAMAHPNINEPLHPRLKTYRRLALAYATHGEPLVYDYLNKEEIKGKKGYFRAVNTASLKRSSIGAKSDKVLLNFINFGNDVITINVRVTMPKSNTYIGDRYGEGHTYKIAHSFVNLETDSKNQLELKETLGSGESVQYILSPIDTIPPTAPANLTATTIDFKQIDLNWNLSKDNKAVSGYSIFRNNEIINVLPSSIAFYSDKNVTERTNYEYSIEAYDYSGNHSDMSNRVTASTNCIPVTPGGPKYEAEDCIPAGETSLIIKDDIDASEGKIVSNTIHQTKCKIYGVIPQEEDYIITIRYRSTKDTQREYQINSELKNVPKYNTLVTLPNTGGLLKEVKQQIKLIPGRKNIITIVTRWGQFQDVDYDYFVLEPGILPKPSAQWKAVNNDNTAILYSNDFMADGSGETHVAYKNGESASFTFEGKGVRWYSDVNSNYGSAVITIDNMALDTVDIPRAAFEGPDKLVYELNGLEDKIHTLKITSLKNEPITLTKLQYLGTKDVLVPPGPDVIVEDILTIPAHPKGGDPVTFVALVKNIGTEPTPQGVITGVGFSVNGGDIGFSDDFNSVIQPGETVEIKQVSNPWQAPQNKLVEVQAYVDNISRYKNEAGVIEQSRSNNRTKKSLFFPVAEIIVEAEKASISGATLETLISDYSGNGYGKLASTEDYFEWEIDVPQSATYDIGIRYNHKINGDLPIKLEINGKLADTLLLAPTKIQEWAIMSFSRSLNKGIQTIRLVAIESEIIHLDYLRLSTSISENIIIKNPSHESKFEQGTEFPIITEVLRNDVRKVFFYADNVLIGEESSFPYNLTWQNAPSGSFIVHTKALTNNEHTLKSAPILITVNSGKPDLVITDVFTKTKSSKKNNPIKLCAIVKNIGTCKTPDNTIMSVTFEIDGKKVNWSNDFYEGHAAGDSIIIEASSGINASPYWLPQSVGNIRVTATVDMEQRIPENEENNNSFSKNLVPN